MYTKEAANIAYGKLPAFQKLHIGRAKRNLLKLYLARQAYYAFAVLEAAVYAFRGLFQFLVLVFAKAAHAGIVRHDPADVAAVLEAVVGLRVAHGGYIQGKAGVRQHRNTVLAVVAGKVLNVYNFVFVVLAKDAVCSVADIVYVVYGVVAHGATAAQGQPVEVHSYRAIDRHDIGVTVQQHVLHYLHPEVESVCSEVRLDVQQIRQAAFAVLYEYAAFLAHILHVEVSHAFGQKLYAPVHRGDAQRSLACVSGPPGAALSGRQRLACRRLCGSGSFALEVIQYLPKKSH